MPMGLASTFALALALLPATPSRGTAAVVTALDASFDDKPVGLAIGAGGAAIGEPTYVGGGVRVVVRSTPFATPSLEIRGNSTFIGDSVRFQFLNSWELVGGTVTMSANLSSTCWTATPCGSIRRTPGHRGRSCRCGSSRTAVSRTSTRTPPLR